MRAKVMSAKHAERPKLSNTYQAFTEVIFPDNLGFDAIEHFTYNNSFQADFLIANIKKKKKLKKIVHFTCLASHDTRTDKII